MDTLTSCADVSICAQGGCVHHTRSLSLSAGYAHMLYLDHGARFARSSRYTKVVHRIWLCRTKTPPPFFFQRLHFLSRESPLPARNGSSWVITYERHTALQRHTQEPTKRASNPQRAREPWCSRGKRARPLPFTQTLRAWRSNLWRSSSSSSSGRWGRRILPFQQLLARLTPISAAWRTAGTRRAPPTDPQQLQLRQHCPGLPARGSRPPPSVPSSGEHAPPAPALPWQQGQRQQQGHPVLSAESLSLPRTKTSSTLWRRCCRRSRSSCPGGSRGRGGAGRPATACRRSSPCAGVCSWPGRYVARLRLVWVLSLFLSVSYAVCCTREIRACRNRGARSLPSREAF